MIYFDLTPSLSPKERGVASLKFDFVLLKFYRVGSVIHKLKLFLNPVFYHLPALWSKYRFGVKLYTARCRVGGMS